jgi:hypothetical protein
VGPGKEEIEVVESKLRGLGVALVSVALLMGFSHVAGASTSSSSPAPKGNRETQQAALLAYVAHAPSSPSPEDAKLKSIAMAEASTQASTAGTVHAESIPSAVCKSNTVPDSTTDAGMLNIISATFAYDCGNDVAALTVTTSDSWVDGTLFGDIAYLDVDGNPNTGCEGDDYAVIGGWDSNAASLNVTLAKTPDCATNLFNVGPTAIARTASPSNNVTLIFKLGSVGYPKALNWDVAIGDGNTDPDWAPDLPNEATFTRPTGNQYYLKNSFSGGLADIYFQYGNPDDTILVGDWNGDGIDTLAVRRGNTYYLTDTLTGGIATTIFSYGNPDDTVVVGDWDGNGSDSIGLKRGNTYYLNNALASTGPTSTFSYGNPGDVALAGDWDGNGSDSIGLRRGNTYYLNNSLNSTGPITTFSYGNPTDMSLVGDWDGNGTDTIGLRRGNTYYLNNSLNSSGPITTYSYGNPDDITFIGDWDANGTDTIGLRR